MAATFGYGSQAQDDSLGIALKDRARQRRVGQRNIQPASPFGPLPDPRWDAYFQALDEAGVDRVTDDTAAPRQYQGSRDPFDAAHTNMQRFSDQAAIDSLLRENPSDTRLEQLRSRSSLRGERPAMNSLRGR